MTRARIWLVTALAALSACASTSSPGSAIRIFDEDLREAFDNLDRTMSEPRPPLALRSGASISTCRDYLQHSARIDRTPPRSDARPVRVRGLRFGAVAATCTAGP